MDRRPCCPQASTVRGHALRQGPRLLRILQHLHWKPCGPSNHLRNTDADETIVISRIGRKMNFRQRVIATASVFFRRFYLKNSYCETDPFIVIAACCYVAAKAEECPVHIKTVINECRSAFSSKPTTSHCPINASRRHVIRQLRVRCQEFPNGQFEARGNGVLSCQRLRMRPCRISSLSHSYGHLRKGGRQRPRPGGWRTWLRCERWSTILGHRGRETDPARERVSKRLVSIVHLALRHASIHSRTFVTGLS